MSLTSLRHDRGIGCSQAAIKFYLDRSAFERERELYNEVQLQSVMPATLAADGNTSGSISTPYGYSFPPFVIIECGQSLDEWSRDNANKDFITVFQVCGPPQEPGNGMRVHAELGLFYRFRVIRDYMQYDVVGWMLRLDVAVLPHRTGCWLSWGTTCDVEYLV